MLDKLLKLLNNILMIRNKLLHIILLCFKQSIKHFLLTIITYKESKVTI